MAVVELNKAKKTFGAVDIIHDVDLRIEDGEFAAFVGPSGCGKSTLLRMIAGLENVTAGEWTCHGIVPHPLGLCIRDHYGMCPKHHRQVPIWPIAKGGRDFCNVYFSAAQIRYFQRPQAATSSRRGWISIRAASRPAARRKWHRSKVG